MKKSTLLSFATAAAIVVTSAGTYAAWDQMTVTDDTATVTIRKAVTQTITAADFTSSVASNKTVLDTNNPTYSASGKITVANAELGTGNADEKYKLQLAVVVKDSTDTDVTSSFTTANIKEATEVDGTTLKNAKLNGDHEYTVTLVPADAMATLGAEYTVEVTSTIIAKP